MCWCQRYWNSRSASSKGWWTVQDVGNGIIADKLHSVKSVLGDWQSSYKGCRKDEIVICHACIGHTTSIYIYILNLKTSFSQMLITLRNNYSFILFI